MPKTIVLTGASDGIGAAAARQLASKGHHLLIVGRSKSKLDAVARDTGCEAFVADFANLSEVRSLAQRLLDAIGDNKLDVLANNAGGIFGDQTPTVDGYEMTFQINHLAHFLLTSMLMPALRRSNGAVINTSSVGHKAFGHIHLDDLNNRKHFSPHKAYGDAKLANVMFTKALHARGIPSVAFHPGNIRSNFAKESRSWMRWLYHTPIRFFLSTPEHGGANLAWFIEGTPGQTWMSGEYYDERKRTNKVNPQVNDAGLVEGLWERSVAMVGQAGASRDQ